MPEFASLMAFAAVALGLVLTPGPNMMYHTSRSICQGKRAGFISLAGVAVGFFFYMLCAAFGITAIASRIPGKANSTSQSRIMSRSHQPS